MTLPAFPPPRRLGPGPRSARAGIILIHGRGSDAADMLSLLEMLDLDDDLAVLAPEAPDAIWYPLRFLDPRADNEPRLSHSRQYLQSLVDAWAAEGLEPERIHFIGFSQGACLALETVLHAPRRYGSVAALSGAIIGGPDDPPPPPGNLAGTPILLGCADQDYHFPWPYVEDSARELMTRGAEVTLQCYPGAAHRVFQPELLWIRKQLKRAEP